MNWINEKGSHVIRFLLLAAAVESPIEEIIDADGLSNTNPSSKTMTERTSVPGAPDATPCIGICLVFPPGKDHHTSYPFGLHSSCIIPWNYHSVEDRFYLQSKFCSRVVYSAGDDGSYRACHSCEKIWSNDQFESIFERIKFGVHVNTPLHYQPIGGLVQIARRKTEQLEQMHLIKLNNNRTLARQAASLALADHKQWVLVVASGRVDRVASLVQACLKRKMGIQGLLVQYICAADKLYKPKGYTHEDIQRVLVLLRLGGSHVAEFAHRSLFLPSPTTARWNSVVSPIRLSVQKPTVEEVEENIRSFLEALAELNVDINLQGSKIKHQIFVLDEFAIEKRPRWDDHSNMFIGICREHGGRVPLEFISEKELDIFCNALDEGTIHAACEVSNLNTWSVSLLKINPARPPLVRFVHCQRTLGKLALESISFLAPAKKSLGLSMQR